MTRKKKDKDAVRLIRNSTAEFLIFTGQAGEQSIEARYEDETVWLSQKLMAELFAVSVKTISEHLNNVYESEELQPDRTIRKFQIVQKEGGRSVSRQTGGSHAVYKMPWIGDPRVNIQKDKSGKAKAYQVKQVLAAIAKLQGEKS